MTLSLGIDVGTSGVRSAVVDADDRVLSMARAAHLPQVRDRINAEHWWTAVCQCLHAQITELNALGHRATDITRITVDGTSGSMVLTDEHLTPVSRALMYNSKGFEEEAALIATYAPDVHITRGSGSALARALRLLSEVDRSGARHLLHQADFIAAKLTGRGGYSDHNNALKTGFDPETKSWPSWFAHLLNPDLLPTALPVGQELAPVSAACCAEFGFSPDARVHAGTTDSIAAFLAAAPGDLGNAVTSIGSTLAVKVLSPKRIDDPTIGLYSHKLGSHWLAGGASNTGGAVLAAYFSVEEIIKLSAEIDPSAPTDLSYYPLLKPGERFPVNDPNLPPVLTPRPASDATFLQGLFEGMARIEAQCYSALVDRGGLFPTAIFTAGGAAQNAVLKEIRERALGVKLEPPLHAEAAVGVAKAWKVSI